MEDPMEAIDGSVRSGEFVAQHINPDDNTLDEEAIQPNGVDLSIGQIFRLEGESYIANGDDYDKCDRIPVEARADTYSLDHKYGYIVTYSEVISIPEDHVGFVYPRSRLMRSCIDLSTAVWDAGYKGIGEGSISLENPCIMEQDARIAQIVFIKTESLEETYSGTHQHEKL